MEILSEHNSYITIKADEIGIPPRDLIPAWDAAISQQRIETPDLPESDPMFTRKVMDNFDKKVNQFHVEKARNIVMARENVLKHGQEWINSIAQNNYIKANEEFPRFAKAAYEGLIDSKSKEFLAKFAEKLKNSSSKS